MLKSLRKVDYCLVINLPGTKPEFKDIKTTYDSAKRMAIGFLTSMGATSVKITKFNGDKFEDVETVEAPR